MSPAGLAMVASNDDWKYYDHLRILNQVLLLFAAKRFFRLMTWMPPQHGKSELISRYFPVWLLGQNPDYRIILSSYEADFAADWGRKARDVFYEWAPELFNLKLRGDSSSAKNWNIEGHDGGMTTSGAGGSQTGKKADFFDIDDPHKNPKEAKSPVFQRTIYDWYLEAVDTRLPKDGVISITQTRWDTRDLSGRILYDDEGKPNEPHVFLTPELLQELLEGARLPKDMWLIVHLPAIALRPASLKEATGQTCDLLGRSEGEALCTPLFPKDVLLAKKNRMRLQRFDALYQGLPVPSEGDMFKLSYFKRIGLDDPLLMRIKSTGRGYDLAGTRKKANQNEDQGPARTAGVLASITKDADFIVHNCVSWQERPGAIRTNIVNVTRNDQKHYGSGVKIRIAHDPGQAAIDQMEQYKKALRGVNFKPFREADIGSKEDRAENVATQGELFNIYIVETGNPEKDAWIEDYINEHTKFPAGNFKDKVDATSVIYADLFKVGGQYPEGINAFKMF
jgi:predicted phage terminase large subunit-like protein